MHLLAALGVFLSLIAPIEAAEAPRFRVEQRKESFVSGGRTIRVETFSPAAPGRFPAVLVLHSSAGTLLGKSELQRFSRMLAERGLTAFLVRYFDRTGTLFAGGRAIDEHSGVWTHTVKDAVDFATAHPRVRRESIGLFGYSLGAYLAVAEASRDTRIDAVVEIAGGIFAGFAPRMLRLPPTLMVHGRDDQRVPVARAFELEKKARRLGSSPEVKIYNGEGHRLSQTASEDATRRALGFFRRHLEEARVSR